MAQERPLVGRVELTSPENIIQARAVIRECTMRNAARIVASTPGASLRSALVIQSNARRTPRPAPTNPLHIVRILNLRGVVNPNHIRQPIQVVNADTFTFTRGLLQNNPEAQGRVVVLDFGYCWWKWWWNAPMGED